MSRPFALLTTPGRRFTKIQELLYQCQVYQVIKASLHPKGVSKWYPGAAHAQTHSQMHALTATFKYYTREPVELITAQVFALLEICSSTLVI